MSFFHVPNRQTDDTLENADHVTLLKCRARFKSIDPEFARQVASAANRVGDAPPRFDADKVASGWIRTPNAQIWGIGHGNADTMFRLVRNQVEGCLTKQREN